MSDDGRELRPLSDDPTALEVEVMFDLASANWIVGAPGDYQAAAVEAFLRDGSGYQECVAVEWPGRVNHTDELRTVRLLLSPEDALGLSEVIAHSARYLLNRRS